MVQRQLNIDFESGWMYMACLEKGVVPEVCEITDRIKDGQE